MIEEQYREQHLLIVSDRSFEKKPEPQDVIG
jgi:hypothetical protein